MKIIIVLYILCLSFLLESCWNTQNKNVNIIVEKKDEVSFSLNNKKIYLGQKFKDVRKLNTGVCELEDKMEHPNCNEYLKLSEHLFNGYNRYFFYDSILIKFSGIQTIDGKFDTLNFGTNFKYTFSKNNFVADTLIQVNKMYIEKYIIDTTKNGQFEISYDIYYKFSDSIMRKCDEYEIF